jgi:hypothetical protein
MNTMSDSNANHVPSRFWRGISVCAATLAILVGLSIRAHALRGALQRPYATFPGEGSEWIKWTDQERQLFVAGYVAGYAGGAGDACRTFDLKFSGGNKWNGPEDNPLANCRRATPHFSRPLAFYVERLTQFYVDNKEYRKAPAYVLMNALADEREGTKEELVDATRSINPM